MKKILSALFMVSILIAAAFAEEIFDADDLIDIGGNGEYVLMNDIDMRGVDWLPREFSGTFDGNGHTLYNLSITRCGDTYDTTIDGNHKEYKTELVGLFSRCEGAAVKNLNIIGASCELNTEHNAFAAIVTGTSLDSVFENINISGQVTLYTAGKMGGVAGIVGFGTGSIEECSADVTLVYVDTNQNTKCEQFMGGMNACGYMDIIDCTVWIDGYASVHGYVHNGGIVGMHHNHDANYKPNTISGCTCAGQITFFEHNSDRRAYCKGIVGEKLNNSLTLKDNNEDDFISNEVKTYNTTLLPETCEEPDYFTVTVLPTEKSAGYDIRVCRTCGCTVQTNYVLWSDWVIK